VAVAADPDGRPLRELVAGAGIQPLIKLEGVAADVGVGRTRHLEPATFLQDCLPLGRLYRNNFFRHPQVLAENSHWRCGAADTKESGAQLRVAGVIRRYTVSFTAGVAAGFFAGVVVITTTLIRTNRVPKIVLKPRGSPPKKYPSTTATTGFT